jgi:hypothetical protein
MNENPVAYSLRPRRQAWRILRRHSHENPEEEALEWKKKTIQVSSAKSRHASRREEMKKNGDK